MSTNLLETKGLTVQFGGFKAISDLDFAVKQGELRVILGPNGAGKTTLMDLITGKTKPTAGTIHYDGKQIGGMEPYQTALLGIGRKFQNPHVFDNMTVLENIEVAFRGYHQVFRSLFYRKNAEMKDRMADILSVINLIGKSEQLAVNLSHGERQWLEIGMLLAQDPKLIILDEPTAGMTAEETFKTGELVQSVFSERTVIVVEHDMAFVRQIANVVTVLHQGKFLAEGLLSDIENNAKVQEVYLKEDAHA